METDIVRSLRLPRAVAAFACGGSAGAGRRADAECCCRNRWPTPLRAGDFRRRGGRRAGGDRHRRHLRLDRRRRLRRRPRRHAAGVRPGPRRRSWTQTRLLLTGVIVAAGCGAAVALMLSLAPEGRVKGMLFWLMGDASGVSRPWPALLLLAAGLVAAHCPSRANSSLLARGRDHRPRARRAGRTPARLVYGLGALLTAVAVTTVGSVGFVGLIVPHLVRLAIGNDQRLLPPAAASGRRRAADRRRHRRHAPSSPIQLPVGVLTALIGVPVFPVPAGAPPAMKMDAARPAGRRTARRRDRPPPGCRQLDFTLQAGDTLVILGRNGARQNTLLHTLAGLRDATGGDVLLAGQPYASLAARPRSLPARPAGPEPARFLQRHRARDGARRSPPYLGRWDWESPEDETIALAALDAMGLAGFAGRQVPTLSGGERQRLAIAALLVQQPRLAHLLDEPLAHLDLHHQVAVLDHFQALAAAGAGVTMVLHDINLAARYASHVLLLDGEGGTSAARPVRCSPSRACPPPSATRCAPWRTATRRCSCRRKRPPPWRTSAPASHSPRAARRATTAP